MATRKRRTKGAGSIIHGKDGTWRFRKDLGADPATGKRRYVEAKGRTKAEARERFDAKIAELERTGLMPGAKSPYLNDYVERWLEDYRLRVKPTTYRTRPAACAPAVRSSATCASRIWLRSMSAGACACWGSGSPPPR